MEEAVRNGIPIIAVDPQGDIASLAVKGDREKLAAAGTAPTIQDEFFERARIALFTPASTKGIPLSVSPLRMPPADTPMEEAVYALDITAVSLTGILGYDPTSSQGKGVRAYLYVLLDFLFKAGKAPRDISELVQLVQRPPAEIADELATLVPPKESEDLARKLRFLTIGAPSLLFELGMKVDIDAFLDKSDGKVPVNVIYLNSITSEVDRQFFLAILLREIYLWMLKHPSKDVQLLVYIDEIAPYIPPYPRNPPPKEAYALLFRQARKYGIGLVATTQNVTDIDYKALGQANTWCLGRLVMQQDIARVEKIIRSIDPDHAPYILDRLPSLKAGEFVLLSPDVAQRLVEFRVRRLVSKHVTLEDRELGDAMAPEAKSFFDKYTSPGAETRAPEAAGEGMAPSLRDRIRQYLTTTRQAASGVRIAKALGAAAETVDRELEKGAKEGALGVKHGEDGEEDLYWLAEYKFQPAAGILSEVLTIPMRLFQADAIREAQGGSGRVLSGKKVTVSDARFFWLPIWKVTARWAAKSRLFSPKQHIDDYYVNARKGTILWLEGRQIVFSKVARTPASDVKDLDDDEHVSFVPKVPSEIGELPEIRVGRDEAFQILKLMFGVQPIEGHLALLPVWLLKTQEGTKEPSKTIAMDAATGRVFAGDY